jgi:hypothetical protein
MIYLEAMGQAIAPTMLRSGLPGSSSPWGGGLATLLSPIAGVSTYPDLW